MSLPQTDSYAVGNDMMISPSVAVADCVGKLAEYSSSGFEEVWSLRIKKECDSDLADALNLHPRSRVCFPGIGWRSRGVFTILAFGQRLYRLIDLTAACQALRSATLYGDCQER